MYSSAHLDGTLIEQEVTCDRKKTRLDKSLADQKFNKIQREIQCRLYNLSYFFKSKVGLNRSVEHFIYIHSDLWTILSGP